VPAASLLIPLGRSVFRRPGSLLAEFPVRHPLRARQQATQRNQTDLPSNAAVFSAEAHRAPLRENRNTRAGQRLVLALLEVLARACSAATEAWYTFGQGGLPLRERDGAPEIRWRVNR